jgi:uncharacterized protein YukE
MAERYTHGMDPGRVRAIADRLAAAQRDLAGVSTRADDAARQLREAWDGEDAQAFARRWPALRQTLDSQAGDMESLVRRLREQAEEQDRASGTGGGGDSDGDGVPNRRDGDDDNDGTPATRDTDDDNDGTPDAEDPDNPGVKVETDPFRDKDGGDEDGDEDGDGNDDRTGDPLDEDGDGTPDVDDTDDDNDGTPDSEDPEHRGDPKRDWSKTWEKEWVDNGPQHKADPSVDVSMELGGVEKELWDGSWKEGTLGDPDGNHLTGQLLSSEGKAEGSWSIDRDGLTTAGTLTAGGYLAKASGAWSNSHGTSASGSAYVGAEANAKGGLSLGLDGVRANAGVDAFVGGKAEINASQDFGPVDAGVGAEVSYGIGAHAEADAEFSADRVGVSVDIGATLGIGGGLEFDLGFDPPW